MSNSLPKLLLLLKMPPPYTGATMMNERIYNSSIIRSAFDTRFITVRYRSSIKHSSYLPLRKLFIFSLTLFRFVFNLIFHRPDIVYFQFSPLNGPFYRDATLGVIARIFGMKVIYHIRVYGIKNNSKSKINRWLYRFIFRKSTIACHSKNMFHDFTEVYSDIPAVLSNGIEDEFMEEDFNQCKGDEKTTFLFISNYLISKGIPTILEACSLLKMENLPFTMNLIGDYTHDYSREDLDHELHLKNLKKEVNVLGPVYGESKKQFLLEANAFIFPTEYEAFGNVALEAMQAALPVIATQEGSLPLIIEDGITGFLIPKKSPEALAEKMIFLINNKVKCHEMGLAGRKKYLENYTIEKFEKRFVQVVKDVVSNSK